MNRVSEKYEVPQPEYQKKKREKGQKKTGKEVVADSSPKLMRDPHLHTQRA